MVIISDGIADLSLHNFTQKAGESIVVGGSGVGRKGGERNQRKGGGGGLFDKNEGPRYPVSLNGEAFVSVAVWLILCFISLFFSFSFSIDWHEKVFPDTVMCYNIYEHDYQILVAQSLGLFWHARYYLDV